MKSQRRRLKEELEEDGRRRSGRERRSGKERRRRALCKERKGGAIESCEVSSRCVSEVETRKKGEAKFGWGGERKGRKAEKRQRRTDG